MGDMPDKVELGYFYAPAPMSEYYYSVIDKETKVDPLFQSDYIRADIHESKLTKLRNALDVAERALDKVSACTKSKTISDILHGSDATILASGLNPYCMNEGRANGNELAFDYSDVFDALTTIKQAKGKG